MPDWIFCPEDRIVEEVAEWIVGGFLDLVVALVGVMLDFWGIIRGAFGRAGGDVWTAGVGVAVAFRDVVSVANRVVLDLAQNAGLAGPVASVAVFVLFLSVTVAFLRGLISVVRKVRIWGI